MLTFLLFGLQKWYSTKFGSTFHQKLISTLRKLLKASFNPLPQTQEAILADSRVTKALLVHNGRELEHAHYVFRTSIFSSTPYLLFNRSQSPKVQKFHGPKVQRSKGPRLPRTKISQSHIQIRA